MQRAIASNYEMQFPKLRMSGENFTEAKRLRQLGMGAPGSRLLDLNGDTEQQVLTSIGCNELRPDRQTIGS